MTEDAHDPTPGRLDLGEPDRARPRVGCGPIPQGAEPHPRDPGVEHRVPLSAAANAILESLPHKGERVFEGHTAHMTMLKPLQRLRAGLTVHGFRASFKTWASEQTSFPAEVCEQALGHTISNAVERAYRRGDLFEKRKRLMDSWADYCSRPAPTGKLVPIRG
jgi:integrase